MGTRNFKEMLAAKRDEGKFVCLGLDSELGKIPKHLQSSGFGVADMMVAFNREIIDATRDLVAVYKPNIAFYEAHGHEGLTALCQTINCIHTLAPDVPVILDYKRGDIENTNAGYVEAAFKQFKADAVTISPYLGATAMQRFLDCSEKGIIILCKTSNPDSDEFQDLQVKDPESPDGPTMPLYQYVAKRVATHWNKNGNCGLVVGATYPAELEKVREIVGDMLILVPGLGKQGGDAEASAKAGGINSVFNSARDIIFASAGPDFAEAARARTILLDKQLHSHLVVAT
jgi:orotidine-5'-phosphate decarboxylase